MLSFAAKGGNPELPPGSEFKPGLPGSARSKGATGRPADGAQGHPDDARRPSEDVGLGHADRFVVRQPAADAEIPLESHPGYRPRCEPATAGNAAAAGPCLTASSSTSACFSSSANSAPRRGRDACRSRAGFSGGRYPCGEILLGMRPQWTYRLHKQTLTTEVRGRKGCRRERF